MNQIPLAEMRYDKRLAEATLTERPPRGDATKVDFFTEDGIVHPIRGSEGYDPELAGEKAPEEPKDATPAHVAEFERLIMAKNAKIEWGRVWDKDGKPLTGIVKGSRHQIKWKDPGPAGIEAWVGGTLTHFHPHEGGEEKGRVLSLSGQDVKVALQIGLGSVRCFNRNGEYMEVVNKSTATNGNERYQERVRFAGRLDQALNPAWREYHAAKWALDKAGWYGRTPSQADIDQYNTVRAGMLVKMADAVMAAIEATPTLEVKKGKIA